MTPITSKKCTKCSLDKPFSEFYPTSGGKFGLKASCKSCEAEYAKSPEQREKRRIRSAELLKTEERKKYMKEYVQKSDVRKKLSSRSLEWYHKNKEVAVISRIRWREENKEKKRHINAEWRKKNRAACAEALARYRAKKFLATPRWANHDAIREIYKEASRLGMHVDHIIPLNSPIVCGLHVENNLQLLPKEENCRKGNKLFDEYITAYAVQRGVKFSAQEE